jgi:hypothetical protein
VKGEVVDKIPESQFVERLVAEAKRIAASSPAEPSASAR